MMGLGVVCLLQVFGFLDDALMVVIVLVYLGAMYRSLRMRMGQRAVAAAGNG